MRNIARIQDLGTELELELPAITTHSRHWRHNASEQENSY